MINKPTIKTIKTNNPKKALFWLPKSMFWSFGSQKRKKNRQNKISALSHTITVTKRDIMQTNAPICQKTSFNLNSLYINN